MLRISGLGKPAINENRGEHRPKNEANIETRDFGENGIPKHKQHRGIFGMAEILKNQLSTKIAENRSQHGPENVPKSKIVI